MKVTASYWRGTPTPTPIGGTLFLPQVLTTILCRGIKPKVQLRSSVPNIFHSVYKTIALQLGYKKTTTYAKELGQPTKPTYLFQNEQLEHARFSH